MTRLDYQALRFDQLRTEHLYDVLALRAAVFIVEQDCAYQDVDGLDVEATHLLGRTAADASDPGRLVAYARWFTAGDDRHIASPPGTIALGRIVTAPDVRGRGLGHEIVAEALRRIDQPHRREVVMHAQAHLERYYARHGFVREGSVFPEDDIPHVFMRRRAEH